MGKRGPKAGSRQWVQEGCPGTNNGHIWRQPYVEDGKWRVRLRRKRDGREFYRTLTAPVLKSKGKGIAAAMAEVSKLAAEEGPITPPPPDARVKGKSVKEALLAWLADQKGHVSAATFIDYTDDVERVIDALGPAIPILDIDKKTIKEKFNERWGSLGARSRQKMAGLIKRIFADLVDDDTIPSSPAVVLKKRSRWGKAIRAARVERHQILTFEEGRKLIKAAQEPVILKYRGGSVSEPIPAEPWILIWLMLSMKVGLRIGDTLGSQKYGKPGLRWKNLDLERGWVQIAWDETKGGHELRVPLADEVWRVLREYRDSLAEPPKPEDRVIPGRVLDPRKTLHRLCRVAGLADKDDNFTGELATQLSPHPLTHHSMRKSFGAWCDEFIKNKEMKRILLGHAAGDVTDLYGGKQPEKVLRKAVNKIPNLLATGPVICFSKKQA